MGKVLVLAWTEEGPAGEVVVPEWAVRAAGLDQGVWEVRVERQGRVVMRRVRAAGAAGARRQSGRML